MKSAPHCRFWWRLGIYFRVPSDPPLPWGIPKANCVGLSFINRPRVGALTRCCSTPHEVLTRKQPLHPQTSQRPCSLELSCNQSRRAGRTFIINHSIPAKGARPGTGPLVYSTQETDLQRMYWWAKDEFGANVGGFFWRQLKRMTYWRNLLR